MSMELQYFYPYKMLFTKLDVMLERVRVETANNTSDLSPHISER